MRLAAKWDLAGGSDSVRGKRETVGGAERVMLIQNGPRKTDSKQVNEVTDLVHVTDFFCCEDEA